MLTVEELVIESLYHRLVLVNVKKDGAAQKPATPTDLSEEIDSDSETQSPGPSGDGTSHSPGGATGGGGDKGGLGFLVVNAMHPYLKRAYGLTPTFNFGLGALKQNGESHDTATPTSPGAEGEVTPSAEDILQQQGIEVTEEIQTILNTGEIQLLKTTLRSPEVRVDLPPTWSFGPSLSHDLSPADDHPVMPRGVSLDNCNQFSLVKIQDKRDVSGRSVVLVQTSDGASRPERLEAPTKRQALKGAKLRKAKSLSDAEPRNTYVTPVPRATVTSNKLALFVQQDEEEAAEEDDGSRTGEREPDSGIWEMIQGMESSKKGTGVSQSATAPVLTVTKAESADRSSSLVERGQGDASRSQEQEQEEDNETAEEAEEEQEPYRMLGNYRLFSVTEKMECLVTAIEPAKTPTNDDSSCPHGAKKSSPVVSKSNQHEQAVSTQSRSLLPEINPEPLTKPAAEISFSIEAMETETESTVSSITDIQCELDQSPLKSQELKTLREVEEESEVDDSEFVTPPSYSEYELKQMANGSDNNTPDKTSSTPYHHPHHHHRYPDPYNTPPSCSPVPRRHPAPWESDEQRIRPSTLSAANNDSGISVALKPPPSRIITYRDPMRSPDSQSLSDSCMFTESSDEGSVYELDLSYEVPAYPVHADWMSKLGPELRDAPINQLAIPGSHISLAIDRDMRMDMDFSKSNYEMAEFLRKLPNLAIFNNFRGLMKKIWKAWMPKQTLSVPQQLEAGVRYLDLRVTKLRGALYGEHGLYTRQLKRYLRQIRDFLEAHPKEVVILHFQTLQQLDKSDKRHLVTTLFQAFGARLARSGVPGTTTLNFLWQNHKQVIVVFPDEDMSLLQNHIFYGLVWPDFELETSTADNQQVEDLARQLQGLDDTESNGVTRTIADKKLHVLKAVLSPDMTMVFGDFKHRCMRELVELETEAVILAWVRRQTCSPTSRYNVIAMDFIGVGTAVSEIVQLNFPKKETIV